MSNNTVLESFALKVVWSVLIGSGTLLSIVGYGILAFIVLKDRKKFGNSFCTLVFILGIFDCLNSATQLYAIPHFFLSPNALLASLQRVSGTLRTTIWFGQSSQMLISINQFITLTFLTRYSRVFRPVVAGVAILVSCVISTVMTIAMRSCGCQASFESYGWSMGCDSNRTCSATYLAVDAALSNLIVILMVIAYAAILGNILVQNHRTAKQVINVEQVVRMKTERALMIQFGVISGVMVVYVLSFWVVFSLVEAGYLEFDVASVILTSLSVANSSINPLLYLTYGSKLKSRIHILGSRTATKLVESSVVTSTRSYVNWRQTKVAVLQTMHTSNH